MALTGRWHNKHERIASLARPHVDASNYIGGIGPQMDRGDGHLPLMHRPYTMKYLAGDAAEPHEQPVLVVHAHDPAAAVDVLRHEPIMAKKPSMPHEHDLVAVALRLPCA